jgi:hypothetical protein
MNTESVNAVEKYCKSVDSKLASYVDLHARLSRLENRSECPLCESELDKNMTKTLLALVSEKLAEMRAEKADLDAKNAPEAARKNAERIEREKKDKLARNSYIESHKSLFAKLLRKWRADLPNFTLPEVPVSERALWNAAIDYWSMDGDNRDDMESDILDFQFEV